MKIDQVLKVLGNAHRRELLAWLKNPRENFPPALPEHKDLEGACATYIYQKSSLSQATVSQYLNALENVGLLKRERHGQWTFFSRDEAAIKQASQMIEQALMSDGDGDEIG